MMDKIQSQQAGDDSQQMQIVNCPITIVNGIDEKRAREISLEVFNTLRKELTNEAFETAKKRVQKLENVLIPRIQKIDETFNAFSDPAFQILLSEAQKTAAKTERLADYELLSELLIQRMEKGSDRTIRSGIDKAVEIVDDISDEALMGLTTLFLMEACTPNTGNISKGLDILNDIFQAVIHDELPTDMEWIDNLYINSAIRVSIISMKKYENFFSESMLGYCSSGIKKCSVTHSKAREMLKEGNLPLSILCDHELHAKYVRLAIAHEEDIEKMTITVHNLTTSVLPINNVISHTPLSERQKLILHKIYALYETNSELKQEITQNLCTALKSRKHLNIAKEWWNNLPNAYQITSVGKALAYANAKRVYPALPSIE